MSANGSRAARPLEENFELRSYKDGIYTAS
jgi:hypothetical protein